MLEVSGQGVVADADILRVGGIARRVVQDHDLLLLTLSTLLVPGIADHRVAIPIEVYPNRVIEWNVCGALPINGVAKRAVPRDGRDTTGNAINSSNHRVKRLSEQQIAEWVKIKLSIGIDLCLGSWTAVPHITNSTVAGYHRNRSGYGINLFNLCRTNTNDFLFAGQQQKRKARAN